MLGLGSVRVGYAMVGYVRVGLGMIGESSLNNSSKSSSLVRIFFIVGPGKVSGCPFSGNIRSSPESVSSRQASPVPGPGSDIITRLRSI